METRTKSTQTISEADILGSLPGYVFWKNDQSIYLGCSDGFAIIAGFSSKKDIIGLTDLQLPWKSKASDFTEEDRLVLQGQKTSTVQTLTIAKNERLTTVTRKTGIRGPNHEIVGVIGEIQVILERSRGEVDHLDPSEKHIFNSIILSAEEIKKNFLGMPTREAECLYFLLRGFTAKEIGKKMGVASRTIEHYTDYLKVRFGVQNKAELLDKAIGLGYPSIFPESLLTFKPRK